MKRDRGQASAELGGQFAQPARLLFIGNFLTGSGQVSQGCEDLANRFEQEGWDVQRTSSKQGRVGRLTDMATAPVLRRDRFDLAQIDVFSGRAFRWAEAAVLALRAVGKPYVLTLHGGSLPEFARRHPRRVRRLLVSADAVTSPSPYLAGELESFRKEIEVIPNPVDLDLFAHRQRTGAEPKLVWVRAFHEVYQPWLAVEVLAQLLSDRPEATLTMHGPDKGDGSLEKTRSTVERLGVSGQVSIGGPIPIRDVPSVLRAGDVFLNTAAVDNAPRSVVEAMACGLCVVSFDVGGVSRLVDDRRNGLMVEPGDAAAMALAVEDLVANPGMATRISRAGLDAARQHDWPTTRAKWEALYSQIL